MKLAMKLMIGSCAMLIFVLIFGFVVFPKMIKGKIKKMTAVVPGSDMREMFIKVPFGLDIKIYLFNVTNPMQVQKGEKPNLVEIGPFCYSELWESRRPIFSSTFRKVDVGNIVSLMEYSTAVSIHIALVRTSSPTDLTNFQHPIYLFLDGSRQKNEWKEKVEISDNENDDTMSYKPMDTYFEENGSGCLSGQEVITVLHPLIVGMINTVSRTKPAMLSLINKAVNAIYRQPTSIYLEAKATDILFNGVIIDCNVQEFAAKAVCSQLQQSPDLRHISDNEFGFSLIGPKNATPGKVFRVYRGKKKSRDLGKIVEFDGKKSMETWPTKDCNKLRGTDGTIFPPFLNKKDGLVSFSPDLCRSLVARFEKSTEYNGIPVWAYTASLGDMSKNADEKCFCPTNDTCLKKGLMDLFKCVGVPLYVSLPHFYDSDIMYLTGVSGLNPKKEKHGIEILFEHMTGGPVSARKRLQFNMPLEPNAKVALFNDLPTVIHPIFWIEEGVSLNDTFTKPIKGLFRILKIFKIFKWILLLASLVGISASAYMMYKNTGTVSISPVHQVKPSDRISPISRIHGEFIAHNNNETKHVENGRY